MYLVIKARKKAICVALLIGMLTLITFGAIEQNVLSVSTEVIDEEELRSFVNNSFAVRNTSLLEGNADTTKELYDVNKRNGLWAFEHETQKMKYIGNWSQKQGVSFTDINSTVTIKWYRCRGQVVTVNLLVSTTYQYIYQDQPETKNSLRIGTYHELQISEQNERWLISREWYTDPFADSLNLNNLKMDENRIFILSQTARDFSSINSRRVSAVAYADQYCGAADSGENNYSYNKKYKDYNSLGGDCANFASQILFEGAKFSKNGTWNYDKDGSMAWLSARGFKNYMLNSGRASLIAYGTYNNVMKASYKLLPGDMVAYEKKGKVCHISVVTGADSRGYSLVNCHNTDRYRVPWDLGWSNSNIKFYLLRVQY
jgi:hypothetical protein